MPRPLPLALLLVAGVQGFYLPGVAVHEYAQDERVDIKVNKLTSTKTQLVRTARHRTTLCAPLRCTLVCLDCLSGGAGLVAAAARVRPCGAAVLTARAAHCCSLLAHCLLWR